MAHTKKVEDVRGKQILLVLFSLDFFWLWVQMTVLLTIGLLNMVAGVFAIYYLVSEPERILILDFIPKEYESNMERLLVHSYMESVFQIILGNALVCLLMTQRNSRAVLGTCWIWFDIFGRILSVANFAYSFTLGCSNSINPTYFILWFTIHMIELMCISYYVRSQRKPKKKQMHVILAEFFDIGFGEWLKRANTKTSQWKHSGRYTATTVP